MISRGWNTPPSHDEGDSRGRAELFALVEGVISAGSLGYPTAPGLTYLYSVNITGGEAALVGQGPRGFRIVVPILYGSFEGPRLKGELFSWNVREVDADPDAHLKARSSQLEANGRLSMPTTPTAP